MTVSDPVADALEEIRAFTSSLRARTRQDRAAFDASRSGQAEDEAAAARRAGEHGPAWQRLQQRIDLHQTTLADIVGGTDLTEPAREVRHLMSTQLARGRELYVAAADDPDLAEDLDQAKAARQDLAQTLVDLARTRERP